MATTAIIVIGLIIIALLLYYVMHPNKSLSPTMSASTMQTINATSLTGQGSSINYAYSIWFFVNEWTSGFGSPKIIFGRMTQTMGQSSSSAITVADIRVSGPCPTVTLSAYTNDLVVYLAVDTGTATPIDEIRVTNIPLQKWVHLVISINGKTQDTYIDGKLTKTQILQGLANIVDNENVYITPMGGFNGWTSNFQYFSTPLNPQQVWNIYKQGYSGSFLSSLSNSFNLTVTVNNNGVPTKSFSI
jgi:hypothetical protein